MNQRLQQLRLEACHHAKAQYPNDIVEWSMCMSERFAELIVRECAEVADNADATRQKWEGIGKYVRQHFGVKE